jgi:hypothetical protein
MSMIAAIVLPILSISTFHPILVHAAIVLPIRSCPIFVIAAIVLPIRSISTLHPLGLLRT